MSLKTTKTTVLLACGFAFVTSPAWPCSVVGPMMPPGTLIRSADAIVVVRAQRAIPSLEPASPMTSTPTDIEFTVREVLKGTVAADTLRFNGTVSETDDKNDRPVPYDFVRPAGRRGNCYALEYRLGADYLFILKSDRTGTLTPYWNALQPTNEQLFGDRNDPWYMWVRKELSEGGRN